MSSLFDEKEDDLSLRTRRTAADRETVRERSAPELDDHNPADREVTLNTGTVLALFFTLALICAVFFGFGYSMGRKSAVPVSGADTASTATPASADTASATKPAPGSPAIQAIPGYMSQNEADDANSKAGAQTVKPPAAVPAPRPARVDPETTEAVVASPKPAPVVRTPPAVPAAVPVVIPPVSSAPNIPGATYVQIAAVSHQEDADVLLNALKRRGYKVLERSDPADRLIHVQIGPFPDRKTADVTRQKLLADGYNAFLK